MKKIIYHTLVTSVLLGSLSSCQEKDGLLAPNSFSDVSFICSQINSPYSTHIIESGMAVSFMDLSRNALTHQWQIQEGAHFLKGEYSKEDTIFTDFIIPNAGLASDENTVFILFEKAGTSKVKLLNTFEHAVQYNGIDREDSAVVSFPGNYYDTKSVYDEATGVHVFDFDLEFKVLDKVNADIKLYHGEECVYTLDKDQIVDASTPIKTLQIPVGDSITIVTQAYGEPTESLFKINEDLALASSIEQDSIENNPVILEHRATYIAMKMGTGKLGSIQYIRNDGTTETQTEPIQPAGKITKLIPVQLEIGAPEGELSASAAAATDPQNITVKTTSLLAAIPTESASNFKVYINNAAKGLVNHEIAVTTATLADNQTDILLSLGEPIYQDDEVSVSYAGSTITDEYQRPLEPFDKMPVAYFSTQVSKDEICGFEGEVSSDKQLFGWYIQHFPVWNLSTEKAYTGLRSMKYDAALHESNFKGTKAVFQSSADNSYVGPAGDYIIKAMIWINPSSTLNNLVAQVKTSKIINVFFDLSSVATGEWVEIATPVTVTEELVAGKSKLNFQINYGNTGHFFLDDVKVVKVAQLRP